MHAMARLGGGRRDQLEDHLVNGEGASAPVHADLREEPVLDLVPFAGAGRQVADGDGQTSLQCEAPELVLPGLNSIAIASTPIGADQELVGVG